MHKNAPLAVTLIVGAFLAIGAMLVVREWETERARSQFALTAVQHDVILHQRLSSALEAVESIGAFYAASEEVTRDEFKLFTGAELGERYHSIQALEWIPRVKAADRAAFEAAAREDGYEGFTFTERHSQGRMVPAGDRDEYFPVYFVEPLRGNEAALGFDLGSNPARLAALEKARDSGELIATERITLVQETSKSFGFLVFQPVYRNGTKTDTVEDRRRNLQGFALGVLRVKDFAGMPASMAGGPTRNMNIFVFDQSAPADRQRLYPTAAPFNTLAEAGSANCVNIPETVGGRDWIVAYCPSVGGALLVEHWQSLFVLVLGLLLTGVTAAYIRGLKKVASALRKSEARYSDIVDNAQVLIQSFDPDEGRFVFTNRAWRETLGYGPDEVAALGMADVIHPDSMDHCMEVLQEVLKGKPVGNIQATFVSKDGLNVELEGSVICRRNEDGTRTTHGVFTDVTDRKLAEAQVIQAAKLATLGEMATSVAHELNQPLNVIRMAAGNVMRKLKKGNADPAYLNDKLERISSQTERAAAIIDHMRMFGRKADEKPYELDPCDAVKGALDMMGEQLRLADIEVVTDLFGTCRPILGHRVQMEQVILNLLTNARDAIQGNPANGGGKITLAVDDGGDDWVRITVSDTGGGIPPKVINRIFEPFFTTKEMGEGTGLGLSVSYGIIRDMGGTIEAENADGGAKFTITLPVAGTDAEKGRSDVL